MSKKVTQDQFDELEERVKALEDMLRSPWIYSSELYRTLYERNTALWAKFSRLYAYLDVEEVTEPQTTLVRRRPKNAKAVDKLKRKGSIND